MCYNLNHILGQAVYPLWWPSLTKDMQTEQLLCWSGMTDTEHYNIWFKRRGDNLNGQINIVNISQGLTRILLRLEIEKNM